VNLCCIIEPSYRPACALARAILRIAQIPARLTKDRVTFFRPDKIGKKFRFNRLNAAIFPEKPSLTLAARLDRLA
jgi:hypothetical protein